MAVAGEKAASASGQLVSVYQDDARSRRGGLFTDEPRSGNSARIAVQGPELAEAVIRELGLAGLLSEAALQRIRARGEGAWDRRWRDLAETRDLTEFH